MTIITARSYETVGKKPDVMGYYSMESISISINLLKMRKGQGWRWGKLVYEDASLQDNVRLNSVLGRSIENPSGGRAST
jgi:hypothetical protein